MPRSFPHAPAAVNNSSPASKPTIRWWIGIRIFLLGVAAIFWTRLQSDWAFQKRNLITYEIVIVVLVALLLWWTFLSRAPTRLRLSITFGLVGVVIIGASLFRLRGMSGDMMPILEFRWSRQALSPLAVAPAGVEAISPAASRPDFPQFLGPNRDGVLPGPQLETNWTAHPPELLWRQKVGAAWSGFAVVGNICLTQEQRGEDDCVVAYDLLTGKQLWAQATRARYDTVIAGEGPRATPTVVSNRVLASGGTGVLSCLDLNTGAQLWARDLLAESGGKIPQWGYACSPLVVNDLVVVHGGEGITRSLFAFQIADGKRAWVGGTSGPSYASPILATLAGVPQILAFNDGSVSGLQPDTGATLWEKPWGNGNVVCATPVVINPNQVLFSSGYGVGAELLEIAPAPNHRLAVRLVWKSIRMKAKFSHLFARDGSLYGLDDGIFACVNLADGSQRWKEGRYGHGQGLSVGQYYLLMAESGELVLLQPTPAAPNELARFRAFTAKTWNPIALSGDLLLVRNDQEAMCLRLKLAP